MIVIKNARLRTALRWIIPLIAIPLLVLLGATVFEAKRHLLVSFGIALLAAMLLLVALVGAVVLTLRRRTDARYTPAGEAVKVNPADRISLIEMEAEKMAENPQEGGEP